MVAAVLHEFPLTLKDNRDTRLQLKRVVSNLETYTPSLVDWKPEIVEKEPGIAESCEQTCCSVPLEFSEMRSIELFSLSRYQANTMFMLVKTCPVCKTKYFPEWAEKPGEQRVWSKTELCSDKRYYVPTLETAYTHELMNFSEHLMERGRLNFLSFTDCYEAHIGNRERPLLRRTYSRAYQRYGFLQLYFTNSKREVFTGGLSTDLDIKNAYIEWEDTLFDEFVIRWLMDHPCNCKKMSPGRHFCLICDCCFKVRHVYSDIT